MFVAQITAPGRIALVDVLEPELDGRSEWIKVRLESGCLCGSDVPAFACAEFFRGNLRLIGSVGPDAAHDFSLARDWIVQRRVDLSPLITHVLPFRDVAKAFDLFVNRKDGAIKVCLDYTA